MCSAAKDMGPHYYTGSGEILSKSSFLDSLSMDVRDRLNQPGGPTVVLMGENHSDPAAHTIELDVLKVCFSYGRLLKVFTELNHCSYPIMNRPLNH